MVNILANHFCFYREGERERERERGILLKSITRPWDLRPREGHCLSSTTETELETY